MNLNKYRNNSIKYKGHVIEVHENDLYIDSQLVLENVSDINSAYAYGKSYVNKIIIIENNSISKDNIAFLISKHHEIKLTNKLVEAYAELISSNNFTLDPVILDLKEGKSYFNNKYEFTLNDGTIVAIDESTIKSLNELKVDKYKLIDYMNESKENFMNIVQELRG